MNCRFHFGWFFWFFFLDLVFELIEFYHAIHLTSHCRGIIKWRRMWCEKSNFPASHHFHRFSKLHEISCYLRISINHADWQPFQCPTLIHILHFATVKASIRWHIVISRLLLFWCHYRHRFHPLLLFLPLRHHHEPPSPPPPPPQLPLSLLLIAINCQSNKLMNTLLRARVLLFEWHIIRFDHCCAIVFFFRCVYFYFGWFCL